MELTPENCEYPTSAIKGHTNALEEAICAAQRLSVEIAALDAKMSAFAPKQHKVTIRFETPKGRRL